jgi:ABC-type multidrug transport system ATPase subunit
MRDFDVRAGGPALAARKLSGGNQQKVALAREIGRIPRVLIAFQPTWGLDPGATRFVMDSILAMRERGGAVLYISSELEEVLAVGDRIGVLSEGRVVDLVDRAEADARAHRPGHGRRPQGKECRMSATHGKPAGAGGVLSGPRPLARTARRSGRCGAPCRRCWAHSRSRRC